MLNSKVLIQMLPGLAASMGFPLPPQLDIEGLLASEPKEEVQSINPFDTIKKLKFLSQLNDHDFRRLFMKIIMNPENTILSTKILEAACTEAARFSTSKE